MIQIYLWNYFKIHIRMMAFIVV